MKEPKNKKAKPATEPISERDRLVNVIAGFLVASARPTETSKVLNATAAFYPEWKKDVSELLRLQKANDPSFPAKLSAYLRTVDISLFDMQQLSRTRTNDFCVMAEAASDAIVKVACAHGITDYAYDPEVIGKRLGNKPAQQPTPDPFDRLLQKFNLATVAKMREHSTAAIELMQALEHRSDISSDGENRLYVEDIKKGSMETIECLQNHGKFAEAREKYNQMLLDLTCFLDIIKRQAGDALAQIINDPDQTEPPTFELALRNAGAPPDVAAKLPELLRKPTPQPEAVPEPSQAPVLQPEPTPEPKPPVTAQVRRYWKAAAYALVAACSVFILLSLVDHSASHMLFGAALLVVFAGAVHMLSRYLVPNGSTETTATDRA